MDAIQKYQDARKIHHQAELKIAKAKAQAELYQKEIASILESEGVTSVAELNAKYQKELESLNAITAVLNNEVASAREVLGRLGLN